MVGKAMAELSQPQHSLRDFHFDLPEHLIATAPSAVRDHSRLLVPGRGDPRHLRFDALPDLLRSDDVLVINNTRVLKARLKATKDSGGRAELLLERLDGEREGLFQTRVSKPLAAGRSLTLEDGSRVVVVARAGPFYRLRFDRPVLDVLDTLGAVPLPPYIDRAPAPEDEERYQTVYGREPGAVAAPTAGLHFTPELLERIRGRGVTIVELTLHVGAGTFQPVRVQDVRQHVMHAERFEVPEATVAALRRCRDRGGRVVAVGTTVVRALEAATDVGADIRTGWQETRIFITPGFRFRIVDALVTNFHLPESTLLMLVSAFAGRERVLDAYRTAVEQGYRFFSYGDAMFLERADDL